MSGFPLRLCIVRSTWDGLVHDSSLSLLSFISSVVIFLCLSCVSFLRLSPSDRQGSQELPFPLLLSQAFFSPCFAPVHYPQSGLQDSQGSLFFFCPRCNAGRGRWCLFFSFSAGSLGPPTTFSPKRPPHLEIGKDLQSRALSTWVAFWFGFLVFFSGDARSVPHSAPLSRALSGQATAEGRLSLPILLLGLERKADMAKTRCRPQTCRPP